MDYESPMSYWMRIVGVDHSAAYKRTMLPVIKSRHSLVAKYLTPEIWNKLSGRVTKTTGFTLANAIACAVELDDQYVGIYAGDWDSYDDFAELFDPIIREYQHVPPDVRHTTDMDTSKIEGNIDESAAQVYATKITVRRNIVGFGLSPGITKQQRLGVEYLMTNAFKMLVGDLAGTYYPLTGMDRSTEQQLVDDGFFFMSGDRILITAGMERDWPEGRGIFHNTEKTFLVVVNEEDQLLITSMQRGRDVKEVFDRLVLGINAIEHAIQAVSDKIFMRHVAYGYIQSSPTNLGTGMHASVSIDLPGWRRKGGAALKKRCYDLGVQVRGTRGESGGQSGDSFVIYNRYTLGYTEVQVIQTLIDAVNTLVKEDISL